MVKYFSVFFWSSRRRHTIWTGDWSSDVCSSDLSTRAAVSVDDENLRVASAVRLDLGAHGRRDALGPIVQLRGQAAHIEGRPAIGTLERRDLACESPAGDEQRAWALVHVSLVRHQAARLARRAASRVLAVSTAIAASRQ